MSLLYDRWTSAVASFLAVLAPGRAMAWARSRNTFRSFYSAAAQTGPNGYWRPVNRSAEAQLAREYPIIQSRVRDLAANNPYISGALVKIVNNVVRHGIRPQMGLKMANGKPDVTRNDKIEAAWRRWARRGVCELSGHDDFSGIQRLVLRHSWVDGELLIRRTYDRSAPGEIPLRLELLECDQLDSSVDGDLGGSSYARRGVEMDKRTGRPTHYHIMDSHPGDAGYSRPKTERVPAADVLHIFDRTRISMTRGVPWFVSIAMEMYDFSDYQSYERVGAKLAAAFGIFVKSQYPELWGSGVNPLAGAPMTDATTGASAQDALPDFIDPGRIQVLPPGTDISIASHNRPGDSYEPYTRTSLRGTSAGIPMSYEAFSNDYTAATYSSARSASLEERLSYQGQQRYLDDHLNGPVGAWFLEALWVQDPALMRGYETDPYRYHSAMTWQAPGWSWVDPYKDASGAEKEIGLVINTRRNLAAQRGMDWDEIVDQQERELDRMLVLAEKKAKLERLATDDGGGLDAYNNPVVPNMVQEFQNVREKADAYGVAVRAGAVTPQQPDEEHFRMELGLPEMNEAAAKAWADDAGVMRPITLKAGDQFTAEADATVSAGLEES